MYRFLLSPRWIGLGVLMILAAVVMVLLGLWQLDRYHTRTEINARIDSASTRQPASLDQVLSPPTASGTGVGPAPDPSVLWTRVTVTGRYDPAHEFLVRGRSVNGRVGFEVVTPLVRADGTAVLVDRGWVAPSREGVAVPPQVPPAPSGEVTVVGRLHAPESRADNPAPLGDRLSVRRIAPQRLAEALPYPIYGAYVTLEEQSPPADEAFVPIQPRRENAALNAAYVVQWWLFAGLTLTGYVVLVVREARSRAGTAQGRFKRLATPV